MGASLLAMAKSIYYIGALASQATVPFIKLQYAYKCPLQLSKIKCTKSPRQRRGSKL